MKTQRLLHSALAICIFLVISTQLLQAEPSLIERKDSFHWYNEAKYNTLYKKDYKEAMRCVDMSLKKHPHNLRAKALKNWLQNQLVKSTPPETTEKTKEVVLTQQTTETLINTVSPVDTENLAARLKRELHLRIGEDALVRRDFKKAREEFLLDLKENPDRVRSMFYIVKHTIDNGDWLKGIQLLNRLLDRKLPETELTPEMKDVILYQLSEYQKAAFLSKAIRTVNRDIVTKKMMLQSYPWKTILKDLPETSEIRIELENVDHIDLALFRKKRALPPGMEVDPKGFYLDRDGNIYPRYNFFREKQDIFLPVIKLDYQVRKDVDELISQGDYYSSVGSYDRAMRYYLDARRLDPASAIARNNIGVIYKLKGRINEAITEFKSAIALEPSYSEPLNNLAIVYSEIGELNEALKLLAIARKLNKIDPRIYFNLGLAWEKQENIKKAREFYLEALELKPNYDAVLYRLGKLELARKNKKQALTYFRRLQKIVPRDSEDYKDLIRLIQSLK